MAVFGVNEIAMRLPGVLLSCAAVWLTFLIGRLLFTPDIALLAAGFQVVNGFLVALAAGRRVADHVDTALIVFIELGIWAALRHARDRRVTMLLLAGVALGAGLLTKSLPALLIVPVAFVVFAQQESISRAMARCAVIIVTGVAVAAPWMMHISAMFPREAAAADLYTLMHLSHTLEGHEPRLFAYVAEMPRFFGELVWIPLVAVAVAAIRDRAPELRMLLAWWVAVPYVTFSVARTQLPGYVMPAAPALFLIQAYFWFDLRRRLTATPRGWQRVALIALLLALTFLPARDLLESTGAFERRDRSNGCVPGIADARSRGCSCPTPSFSICRCQLRRCSTQDLYTAYRQMPTDDQILAC